MTNLTFARTLNQTALSFEEGEWLNMLDDSVTEHGNTTKRQLQYIWPMLKLHILGLYYKPSLTNAPHSLHPYLHMQTSLEFIKHFRAFLGVISALRKARKANDFSITKNNMQAITLVQNTSMVRKAELLGHRDAFDSASRNFSPSLDPVQFVGDWRNLQESTNEFRAHTTYSAPPSIIISYAQQQQITARFIEIFSPGIYAPTTDPLCRGYGQNVRIGMTYKQNGAELIPFISDLMHECVGHAHYRGFYDGIDDRPETATDEAMALFWEFHILRSPGFCTFLHDVLVDIKCLDRDISADQLHHAFNAPYKTNDRKSAHQNDYPLHCLHRIQVGYKMLTTPNWDASTFPSLWQKTWENLGGTQQNNCLQDIHPFVGMIAYFPSYLAGQMMAANMQEQFYQEHPALMNNFCESDIKTTQDWLTTNAYGSQNAQRLYADLSPKALLKIQHA